MLSYLPEGLRVEIKKAYYQALAEPSYPQSHKALGVLAQHREKINRQETSSLREGKEELLTLHKL